MKNEESLISLLKLSKKKPSDKLKKVEPQQPLIFRQVEKTPSAKERFSNQQLLLYIDTAKQATDTVLVELSPGELGFVESVEVPRYIGGTTKLAREEFWSTHPIISNAVSEIAKQYGLNPKLLKSRVSAEGFIDNQIKNKNFQNKLKVPHGTLHYQNEILYNPDYVINGFYQFGLDDVGTLLQEGKIKPINVLWTTSDNENEKGRKVLSATGRNNYENISLNAATLKYFRDLAQKDFPDTSSYDLDRYASAYYNRGASGGKKWVLNGAVGYDFKKGGRLIEKNRNKFKFKYYKP